MRQMSLKAWTVLFGRWVQHGALRGVFEGIQDDGLILLRLANGDVILGTTKGQITTEDC